MPDIRADDAHPPTVDLRGLVLAELDRRGLNPYWLATRLHARGECGPAAVYRWLNGESDTRATIAGAALAELGLRVVPDPDAKIAPPPEARTYRRRKAPA